jgi:hypothetical protein
MKTQEKYENRPIKPGWSLTSSQAPLRPDREPTLTGAPSHELSHWLSRESVCFLLSVATAAPLWFLRLLKQEG